MFICLDCHALFEKPKHYRETHGLESGPYEEWNGCPKCAGTFSKVMPCNICGALYPESELHTCDDLLLCEDCHEWTKTIN